MGIHKKHAKEILSQDVPEQLVTIRKGKLAKINALKVLWESLQHFLLIKNTS